jgi:probable HAF family extracellular repeat protein
LANGINETGQIVGGSDITDDSVYHAVRWQNEGMLDLGTLGGSESEAFGINEAGQIVGVSDISSDEFHAFLTSRCTPPDAILTLMLLSNIEPPVPVFKEADINNDGKIGFEEAINALQVEAGIRP